MAVGPGTASSSASSAVMACQTSGDGLPGASSGVVDARRGNDGRPLVELGLALPTGGDVAAHGLRERIPHGMQGEEVVGGVHLRLRHRRPPIGSEGAAGCAGCGS